MRVRMNTRKGSKRTPLTIFRINTYTASVTVDSKELAETLSRLDATLTKNTGGGGPLENVRLAGVESNFLHRGLRFGILHEGIPNETAAVVFRHQHGDAQINAQHVRVIPSCERIESIDEAVLLPHLIPVRTTEISQNSHGIVEEKQKRAAGRARHDASIDRPKRPTLSRRPAPRRVALHVIGSADSPKVFAVVGETVAQREAKKFVGLGCLHGILKIIRVGVALVAKIEPRMRILMRKNWIVAGNVFYSLIFDFRARPRILRVRRHRMRRRANRQEIDHHQFAVMLPASVQKSRFRMPPHRESFAAVQHPRPVHAFVNFCGKLLDFLIG